MTKETEQTNPTAGDNSTKPGGDVKPSVFDPLKDHKVDLPDMSDSKPLGESVEIPEEKKKPKRGRPPGRTARGKSGPSAESEASAETVAHILDALRDNIGGDELEANPKGRKAVVAVWARYFEETGKEPPLWVTVALTSIGYVGPAFATPKAQGFFARQVSRIKAWREAKKAGIK